MALRPVLITGVALASAGAIVAATPGLMTPPNMAITAGEARAVESPKSVTVNQLNLLALSDIDPQLLSDIYFGVDGWGGIVGGTYDPYYGGGYQQAVDEDGKPVYEQKVDADGNLVVDDEGNPVYVQQVDADGNPVVDADGKPVYKPVLVAVSGDIYASGLSGVAYYLSDQILDEVINAGVPVISDAAAFMYDNVNPYYFEAGLTQTLRVVASELTGGINGPVGQALAVAEDLSYNWNTYAGLVVTLAAAGVPLAGPDLAAATNIYFFGGQAVGGDFDFAKEYSPGLSGVLNYAVDRIMGAPSPLPESDPEDTEDTDGTEADPDTASAKSATAMLTSARKALPTLEKLINLDLKVEDAAQADNLLKPAKAIAVQSVSEEDTAEKQVSEDSVLEKKTSEDQTPAKVTPTGDDVTEAPSGEDVKDASDTGATDGKTDDAKLKKRGWSKINLKGDKASGDDVSKGSPENKGGGKHRQGKSGSWTPKVNDRGTDTTDAKSADAKSGESSQKDSSGKNDSAGKKHNNKHNKKDNKGKGGSKGGSD